VEAPTVEEQGRDWLVKRMDKYVGNEEKDIIWYGFHDKCMEWSSVAP
jgi:hypothetical protein